MRARVKWVEEGKKNTKYFLNLEKSRANSKMMERVTDDKGRTFTKQVDLMNAQRDFFSSNLYKKKIEIPCSTGACSGQVGRGRGGKKHKVFFELRKI